jgi:hypothetical protein
MLNIIETNEIGGKTKQVSTLGSPRKERLLKENVLSDQEGQSKYKRHRSC